MKSLAKSIVPFAFLLVVGLTSMVFRWILVQLVPDWVNTTLWSNIVVSSFCVIAATLLVVIGAHTATPSLFAAGRENSEDEETQATSASGNGRPHGQLTASVDGGLNNSRELSADPKTRANSQRLRAKHTSHS